MSLQPHATPSMLQRAGSALTPYGFSISWAAAVMGISGLIAQQLLLREMLIVFAGNELTIGLIFACWLATEAAGTIWARRTRVGVSAGTARPPGVSDRTAFKRFMWMTLLFCASLFPSLYAIRLIKPALGISVGTVAGLQTAAAASLLVLAPVGLTHGAMFTLGCAVCSRQTPRTRTPESQPPAGFVYIMATLGTLLAGLLWTAALIRLSDPFQIAAGIVLINATVILALSRQLITNRSRWRSIAVFLTASCLLLIVAGGTHILQRRSLNTLWQQQGIVHYENTMHGNIVITENMGQYTFFTDGTPVFHIPIADTRHVEPLVHIPMAAHPDPRRVLLIGGGAGGFLDAILQHPSVTDLTYLELDRRLLQLQQDLATDSLEKSLNDPRVHLQAVDSRIHLGAGSPRYDVIFSRHHNPETLHSSRYFSQEFFQLAADSLSDQGILVAGFPGLVGHLDGPLRNLAAGVHHSLRQVFPVVRVFPGEEQSFLLASADPFIAAFDFHDFDERLYERTIPDAITVPWHVEQRLHPGSGVWFENFISEGLRQPLRDFQPRAMFLSVAHWSSLNAPGTARVLNAISGLNPIVLAAAVLAALLIPGMAFNRFSPGRWTRVIPAVMSTGFSAMVVNLSLLFAFQIMAGRLFGWLGLLSAAFMGGLGLGASYSRRRLNKAAAGHAPRTVFMQTEIAVLLFSTSLLIMLPYAAPRIAAWISPSLIRLLFFPVLLAAGAVCGAQFPAACSMIAGDSSGAGRRREADPSGSSMVYAADLLGGCLGGILGGIVLLPLLGLAGTGVTIGMLKIITLILVLQVPTTINLEGSV